MTTTIETPAVPPPITSTNGEERFPEIYIRVRIVEPIFGGLLGLPDKNMRGIMLLAKLLASEIKVGGQPVEGVIFSGTLNFGNIVIQTSNPVPALDSVRVTLEGVKLWHYVTIFWLDRREGGCRAFQIGQGIDPAAPFSREGFLDETEAHIAQAKAHNEKVLSLLEQMQRLISSGKLPPGNEPPTDTGNAS